MKFGNFTGPNINFIGGFSGGSSAAASGILWDITTYTLTGSLNVGSRDSLPTGIWFSPDGTKLFMVGATQDRLNSWILSIPWDINSATFIATMTSALRDNTGVAITNPTGVSFSDDGTKCFVTDSVNSALYRYSLSTAWDISTLNGVNADQVNTTIYINALTPTSIWVNPAGTVFATANMGATSRINTWSSAVANNITSLSVVNQVAAGFTPAGFNYADNGNRVFTVTQTDDLIRTYTVTDAYTLIGLNAGITRLMTSQDTTPQDVYMRNDGLVFYYLGSATDTIYQFSL